MWDLDRAKGLATIASRAFEVLRTGTLTTSFLYKKEGVARSTIPRAAARSLTGRSYRSPLPRHVTPFDASMALAFDWAQNGGQKGFADAISALEDFVHVDAMDVPGVVRLGLGLMVAEARKPTDRFLTVFAVHATAMDYLRVDPDSIGYPLSEREGEIRKENVSWAQWLHDRRIEEVDETSRNFESLMSTVLSKVGRRPKAGYRVMDIVKAMQAMWSGMVYQSLMKPYDYPSCEIGEGPIETAMWDLAVGMSEEIVASPQNAPRPASDEVIEVALVLYKAGEIVNIDTVAARVQGMGSREIREWYPKMQQLAQACLEARLGKWDGEVVDGRRLAETFGPLAIPVAEAMLSTINDIRTDYPGLLAAAEFDQRNDMFTRLVDFLAIAITDPPGAISPSAKARARQCVTAVVAGEDWEAQMKLAVPRHNARRKRPSGV